MHACVYFLEIQGILKPLSESELTSQTSANKSFILHNTSLCCKLAIGYS